MQLLLQLLTHSLCPRLCSEEADTQFQVLKFYLVRVLKHLSKVQGV